MQEINPSACYVREFSLENVRCFGARQTIDLCGGDGKPARWTVILGDNGVGKTPRQKNVWVV